MHETLIAAAVVVCMTALIFLVYRADLKESKRLAGLARRMGLRFSRRDSLGIGRALNKRFGMRSPVRYGWVRDVMYDSRIKMFRCNEVSSRGVAAFGVKKASATPTVCLTAEAPAGGGITVETSGTAVTYAYSAHPHRDMINDYRARAVGAYLKARPAPYGLVLHLDGGTMTVCYRPEDRHKFNRDYGDGDYRYLAEFAYDVFQAKMEEVRR